MYLPGARHLQGRAGPVEAVLVRVLRHVVVGAQPHLHIALQIQLCRGDILDIAMQGRRNSEIAYLESTICKLLTVGR